MALPEEAFPAHEIGISCYKYPLFFIVDLAGGSQSHHIFASLFISF